MKLWRSNRSLEALKKNGILIFDKHLDECLSTYSSCHLEEIAHIEQHHFWFTTRRDRICQIFNNYIDKKSRILEIGCGTGFIAKKLRDTGFSVEVSDIALNGLLYAKKRGIKKLYQFDLFDPPFREKFDVICLFDVLEHLTDDKLSLEMIKKMLVPGGRIILTVPAHQWLWNQDDVIAGHKRRYTKKKLLVLLQACNLRPLSVQYFFILILPLLLLRTLIKRGPTRTSQNSNLLNLNINPLLNGICYFLTTLEFYLYWMIPNVAGGSLICVAQKE